MNTILKLILLSVIVLIVFYICFEVVIGVIKHTTIKHDQKPMSGLHSVVKKTKQNRKGNYSFYIQNLKTGESYGLQNHRKYDAASLYKLWIMAIVYKKIQDGSLGEDHILSEKASTLNKVFDIPEETAEQTEGTVSFSVGEALRYMITASDNSTALLLTHSVGRPAVRSFLREYGFTESRGGIQGQLPVTTASDIGLFLVKLYKGELANAQITHKMIDLLKKQEHNDSIPKYLPKDIETAHKTGEIGSFAHDAGIIYTGFGDYIFVGLTETSTRKEAKEYMAVVSRDVFNYFKKEDARTKKENEENRRNLIMFMSSTMLVLSLVLVYFLHVKQEK